jgi:hypothetical protein
MGPFQRGKWYVTFPADSRPTVGGPFDSDVAARAWLATAPAAAGGYSWQCPGGQHRPADGLAEPPPPALPDSPLVAAAGRSLAAADEVRHPDNAE